MQTSEALGTIDEAIAAIAVAAEQLWHGRETIDTIVRDLMDIAAIVNGDMDESKFMRDRVTWLEELIAGATVRLPKLEEGHTVIPDAAPRWHFARAVCLRALRRINETLVYVTYAPPPMPDYLARLADYMLITARYIGKHSNVAERTYRPPPCE